MKILYDFHGFDYVYDVPYDAILKIFAEDYPEVDDIVWWLQQDNNQQEFEDSYYEYLKDKFYKEAYEEAREELMDPYAYYGVSRKDFY